MKQYRGKTIRDMLSVVPQEKVNQAIHFPGYPKYTSAEVQAMPPEMKYIFTRPDLYRDVQMARFAYFGRGMLTLVPEGVVDPITLPSYWRGYFDEHFPRGDLEFYKESQGYIKTVQKLLRKNPKRRIVTPHPFANTHMPLENYYLNKPKTVSTLNNKGRINKISGHALSYDVYSFEDFQNETWREKWQLPFVIKVTDPSGGGDGVYICKTEGDIMRTKNALEDQEVKIEKFIDNIAFNYNIQLRIDTNGHISFIGGSEQKVSESGAYGGNFIHYHWKPSEDLEKVVMEIAEKAYEMEWYGVCGLDIIESQNGDFFFIDPNFRLNGSTPFYLMRDYIEGAADDPFLETGYFAYPGKPEELLERFKKEIIERSLIIIGLHYNTNDDITRMYGALMSDADPEKLKYLKEHYENQKGLRPSIAI